MATNQFNNQWKKHYARLVALVLAGLAALVVGVTFLKGCTDIGKASELSFTLKPHACKVFLLK